MLIATAAPCLHMLRTGQVQRLKIHPLVRARLRPLGRPTSQWSWTW